MFTFKIVTVKTNNCKLKETENERNSKDEI